MSDIILKDANGKDVTYTGVETISATTTEGNLASFIDGSIVNEKIETLQTQLDGKLDKVTRSDNYKGVYCTDPSWGQLNVALTEEPLGETAVLRTSVGAINTAEPTEDGHATTKKYVDTAIARVSGGSSSSNVKYQHNIKAGYTNGSIAFSFINDKSDPYGDWESIKNDVYSIFNSFCNIPASGMVNFTEKNWVIYALEFNGSEVNVSAIDATDASSSYGASPTYLFGSNQHFMDSICEV